MAASKQYRRKQDGHIVGPLTTDEAKTLAGFAEKEWDPVEPYQPVRTVDDEPKPKAARSRRRRRKPEPAADTNSITSGPAESLPAIDPVETNDEA
jgi:hypothetical protein